MENNKVIPQLRFPGFKGDWEKKKFKDITFPAGKKNSQNLPYERYSISNEVGFYPQSDQFEDGGGYLKDIDCRQYIVVPPKSFAYNPARINVGSIGYQDLGKEVIVSSLYEVFQTKADCDDSFLWQWFHTDIFRKMVVNVQEGGVRQYFYYEKLKDCVILLPSISEQRRIAECLDSLDQMISAQEQKVEVLTEKKKGLMQELFPQSGESTPRLRFPGFTGEWEQRMLGEVFEKNNERNTDCSIGFDKTISIASMTYNPSGNGAAEDSLKTYKVLRIGDIAFEGHKNKDFAYGRFVMNDIGPGIISPRFTSLRPKCPLEVEFWKKLINYEPIMRSKLVNSTKMGTMMNELIVSEVLKQSLPVPTLAEQQKIASCLSSLDDTIRAETGKLETLKNHKRGLLQQLFPQP
jgi:type I restriction enzyme S subunit